jgi:hypothetical protein
VTQPPFVPILPTDRIRPSDRLPAPKRWIPDRPAEVEAPEIPGGRRFGATGPDLGYGLKLARRFQDRLVLAPGESGEDAVAGCFACGAKRASLFHRAPVIYDLEWAYTLWGYLGGAPDDLSDARRPLFRGASHHYWEQRAIVDSVREATFRLDSAGVKEKLTAWRDLLDVPDPHELRVG